MVFFFGLGAYQSFKELQACSSPAVPQCASVCLSLRNARSARSCSVHDWQASPVSVYQAQKRCRSERAPARGSHEKVGVREYALIVLFHVNLAVGLVKPGMFCPAACVAQLKWIGYNWSCLACRIGRLVRIRIRQPHTGYSFQ
jgi:hypothetical protein